eukprot:s92_g3.t10
MGVNQCDPSCKNSERGMAAHLRSGQTMTGMVKSYNRKGFGFIMCQAIEQDIYFSRESLHPNLQTSDLAGEQIQFEIHRFADGKLQARNLRALGDVSDFKGSSYGANREYGAGVRAQFFNSRGPGGLQDEDRSRDWYCKSCGERNFMKRFECFKCKAPKPPEAPGDQPVAPPVPTPPPKRTLSPHAGSRAMREMYKQGLLGPGAAAAAAAAPAKSPSKSRSKRSASSSSSSSSRQKKRRLFASPLVLLLSVCGLEIEVYHVNEYRNGPVPVDMNSGDVVGEAWPHRELFDKRSEDNEVNKISGKFYKPQATKAWNAAFKTAQYARQTEPCNGTVGRLQVKMGMDYVPHRVLFHFSGACDAVLLQGLRPSQRDLALLDALFLPGRARGGGGPCRWGHWRHNRNGAREDARAWLRAASRRLRPRPSWRKKKKKHKKNKRSSSSDSRSSDRSKSSVRSAHNDPKDEEDDEKPKETNPEIEKAKAEALEKLMKLKEVEPRENRLKEFRILLRKWHPDKNPDQQEVATAVFQFLQKGKLLIESG